jgi:iron(III) transport system ATP-binding protein
VVAVALEQVSKAFPGGAQVVRHVDLTIQEGEFFTLLGPSGCGKTTTLRMIAGFHYPTSGRILFGGRDVTHVPPNDRDTAMVFQNYALFPHLTVFENVAFGLRIRKVAQADVKRRVSDALAQVHLAGLEARRIDQLSGGQQQRVALARALVVEPRLLLLDEPLSNLDAKLREETRSEIRRIQLAAGITAIYVTHDQAEAMAMSDRIAVMEGGIVHQVGAPQEIYHRPATRFVATFIGKSNLIPGTILRTEGGTGWVATEAGELAVDLSQRNPDVAVTLGSQVTLVVRPEGISEARPEERVNVLEATVNALEFQGAFTEYEVTAGKLKLVASMAARFGGAHRVGSPIRLSLPPERIYLVE